MKNRILSLKNKLFTYVKHHKKRVIIVGAIVIIFAIIFWPRSQPTIETEKVVQGDITESITATGTVNATFVNLTFLTGGTLAYVGVKEGSKVQTGQTIATLDQRTVQKNLETQLRNYSEQRNAFDTTKENNQNRTPEGALNDSMKRILQNNQYDLEKAVISVELQNLAKQQAVLTTPISGVVTRADATITGVNVPITTTYTITDFSKSTLDIDVDEADIGRVIPGQPVKITLDAYPDQTFTASVISIDYASHTTSTGGTVYTVQASLPENPNFVYRLGMSADAEIVTNERKNVLLVPLSSITDDNYVYVKIPKGFEKRKVTVGLQNDTNSEVKLGVTKDELVALDPTEAEKLVKK